MKKIFKISLLAVLIFILFSVGYFFVGSAPQAKEIKWGVNFSQKQAENLSLDWRQTYLALLDDLKVKNIKLAAYWDLIEPEEDKYDFDDLDWQIEKTKEKGVNILLVIGLKTPRWPECHIPEWAKSAVEQNLLNYIEKVVNRHKDSKAIWGWQVENEPFFPFGECPKTDKDLLKKEIALVRSLDDRPVLISDSGEWSFWIQAAKLGDLVGTTIYRKIWFKELGFYINYPLNPTFYWRRARLIKKLFNKEVMAVELQAEPWCESFLYDCKLSEQEKTMNLEKFKKNIEFAQNTGLKEFYLWGGEWWYWLKEKQNKPEIWEEAKKLFLDND